MTVPNVPFYLSAADTEFNANNYASDILSKAGVPAPRYCSSLAGKSSAPPVTIVTPPSSNLSVSAPPTMQFYTSGGNIYWKSTGNSTYSGQYTTGIGKLKITIVSRVGWPTITWSGMSDGVLFTPDATIRSVAVDMQYGADDEWVDFKSEVFDATGTILIATHYFSLESYA